MFEDSMSDNRHDDNSSERILQSLQHDGANCLRVLAVNHSDECWSMIKVNSSIEALSRLYGIFDEAYLLEGVEEDLEEWASAVYNNIMTIAWKASWIPHLLKLIGLIKHYLWTMEESKLVASLIVKAYEKDFNDQECIASNMGSIIIALCSTKDLQSILPLVEVVLSLWENLCRTEREEGSSPMHIFVKNCLQALPNISKAIEIMIQCSKYTSTFSENQQIHMVHLVVVMEEVKRQSSSFCEPSFIHFERFWNMPRLECFLRSFNENDLSEREMVFYSASFETVCNIVAENGEDYSQSKLIKFLKKCIIFSCNEVSILMLDAFIQGALTEHLRVQATNNQSSGEWSTTSMWKSATEGLLEVLDTTRKSTIIDAFVNTTLTCNIVIPLLVDIAFLMANTLDPVKENGQEDKKMLSSLAYCVAELLFQLPNKNDFKTILQQCLKLVKCEINIGDLSKQARKSNSLNATIGQSHLAQLILIKIIDGSDSHDSEMEIEMDEKPIMEQLTLFRTMLNIADQLPEDVLNKILHRVATQLLSLSTVNSPDVKTMEILIYNLLTEYIVIMESSRYVLLHASAFHEVYCALKCKLLQEAGWDSSTASADNNIQSVIAIPINSWLDVFGGKCAVKSHLEQLIGLIAYIEVYQAIEDRQNREDRSTSALIERIVSSPLIQAGLQQVGCVCCSVVSSPLNGLLSNCLMEDLYKHGRNNVQFIVHRSLISHSILGYLTKALMLALDYLTKSKTENFQTLSPITLLIEQLQVLDYQILTVIQVCFQMRKEAVRHKEQTKTVEDLEDDDDNIGLNPEPGCEDIVSIIQEMDINSFQHLQDVIQLETKKIQILQQSVRTAENQNNQPSLLSTISVSSASQWFDSITSTMVTGLDSPSRYIDCKFYFWWECKLASVCHSVYILHTAIESERELKHQNVGTTVNNMNLVKILSIIDKMFICYSAVLLVELQQQRMSSLITNTVAAQEWIKNCEEENSNKGKKKAIVPVMLSRPFKYFASYNGLHRMAHLWAYASLSSSLMIDSNSSSEEDESELSTINAFRRSSLSTKKKGGNGNLGKSMTNEQLFSFLHRHDPQSSNYCSSMFSALKSYLNYFYQQLTPVPITTTDSTTPLPVTVDHRWLEDIIQQLHCKSLDDNVVASSDSLQGLKIDRVYMTLRYEMLSAMCSALGYSLDLSSSLSSFDQSSKETLLACITQLKSIMVTFAWDLLVLFSNVGIMIRTFKDYLRSILAIVDLIASLRSCIDGRHPHKSTQSVPHGEDREEFIWTAYILMQILQKGKGLDRTLLCKVIELILALSGADYQRLFCKYLLYCVMIHKNPTLVPTSFFETSLLDQDETMENEKKLFKKLKTSKRNHRSSPTKKTNRGSTSYLSLSSSTSSSSSSDEEKASDSRPNEYRQLSSIEKMHWRLKEHFQSKFLIFLQNEDHRSIRQGLIPMDVFINIGDNKVADVIVYEVVTLLSDKLTDYHRAMVALQQSTASNQIKSGIPQDIKQDEHMMSEKDNQEHYQQEIIRLQREMFEFSDLLNTVLIQGDAARSIIDSRHAYQIPNTPGSANSSPTKRKYLKEGFYVLKSLEVRTVQSFFVLLTSLIEELSQETKLLLGNGRGKGNSSSNHAIQPPIAFFTKIINNMVKTFEYSRLPLLSNCLGMIIPTLGHLGLQSENVQSSFDQRGEEIVKVDDGETKQFEEEEDSSVPSLSLRNTMTIIAKFLVMNNTSKTGTFKLMQSPKSPAKSSCASHKKVTGLINRLKSLRQQLAVLSANIVKHNPSLSDEFLLYAAEAQNLCEELSTEFAPLNNEDNANFVSKKLSSSIAIKLFNDWGEDANDDADEEDLTPREYKKKTKKTKKRTRSRNKIIDDWLDDNIDVDEEGLDAYADLEDFIVGDDVED